MTTIRAFPWHELKRWERDQLRWRAQVSTIFPELAKFWQQWQQLFGPHVRLSVRDIRLERAMPKVGRSVVVGLSSPDADLWVAGEPEFIVTSLSMLAGKPISARYIASAPSDFVRGAFAGACEWFAQRLGGDSFVALEPGEVERRFTGTPYFVVNCLVEQGVSRTHLWVGLRINTCHSINQGTSQQLLFAGDLPIALRVIVASDTMDATSLAVVSIGDALVFPNAMPPLLWNRVSEKALILSQLDANSFRLTGETALLKAPTMDDATEQLAALADRTPLIEALLDTPVVVVVDVGAVTMAAKSWADIQPGDVLVLDEPVGSAVRLRANGKTIARGELVDVEGSIGVRITERST